MTDGSRTNESAWTTPLGYEATAKIPSMPPQRVAMLKAFRSEGGCLLPLMEHLYDVAEKDVGNMARDGRTVKWSMQQMVDDYNSASWVAFDLLKSMSLDTIEACIMNTIGARTLLDRASTRKFTICRILVEYM